MTFHSRTLWALISAVLATGIAIASAAPQATVEQRRGGPGRDFGPGPAAMGMLQRLDLSDAQREQIRAIVDEQRKGDQTGDNLADLQKQLRDAVFADTPDETKIEQLKAAIGQAEAAALSARVATELRIAQVLTPDQRKQARELPAPPMGRGQ